jgi:predicted Zn-dependent protease
MRRPGSFLAFLVLAPLVATISGCTVNPATGQRSFTGLMTTDEEIRIGRTQHPQILKEFGGRYETGTLGKYVDSIGQLLARTVERHDFKYTFTVLNSDIVNAFALPGGYVYITRGLLALAGSEAELAAVLAHELGHITALHHAQRQGQGLLANILLQGLGIAAGGQVANVGGLLAQAALRGFSREHERQSDDLGIRYMARVGYELGAMARFLRKLRAESRLQAKLRGESPEKIDQFNYLATHPAPIERVKRAEAAARAMTVQDPMTAREIYLAKIDGMLYGDDPDQGFIRGRTFTHPRLRFRFEVPAGFRLFNSARSVIAFGPNGVRIVFDQARKPSDGPMHFYLTRVWAQNLNLGEVETIRINGLEAATGVSRINTNKGQRDVRLVAIRMDLQTIYRFLLLTPPGDTAKLSLPLRRATYSFRPLSERDADALKPLRLRIIRVRPGDTARTLAERMPFADFRRERFEVLNGLTRGQKLAPGRRVKLVSD